MNVEITMGDAFRRRMAITARLPTAVLIDNHRFQRHTISSSPTILLFILIYE
jgi:hypothetical protein